VSVGNTDFSPSPLPSSFLLAIHLATYTVEVGGILAEISKKRYYLL